MPLTEEVRGNLVDDLNTKVDFSYRDLDFRVEVYRLGEGFSINNPFILVSYLPANKRKFQSLSDVIGIAKGRFHRFGFAHIEQVTVSCYCQEVHYSEDRDTRVQGRLLCEFLANQCLNRVLKLWDGFLSVIGASIDMKDTIPIIRDLSGYDREKETKFYNYSFEVLIRTRFEWDKVPDDYDESEDSAVRAVVHFDPNEDIRKTIIINTS